MTTALLQPRELRQVPVASACVGKGTGMAVCPTHGFVVVSTVDDTLKVYSLSTVTGKLDYVCTLGGVGSPAPMQH